jgi:hypothetical protein
MLLAVVAAPAGAQRGDGAQAPRDRELGPGEIQRLFDAYTAVQAQDELGLDDVEFGRFLPRLKALQDTRRRVEVERQRRTNELARMLGPPQRARVLGPAHRADDAQLREHLKALADLDTKAYEDVRAAYAAVEQVLDVRRQARFRVFELQMERRKFELVLRARRGEAARNQRQDMR